MLWPRNSLQLLSNQNEDTTNANKKKDIPIAIAPGVDVIAHALYLATLGPSLIICLGEVINCSYG